ncbi:rare lipoprotein A [Candidatus Liberibacter africanus PTSAPSY]|uniref:Endolytic peptidoglycan transglycosylase RlpA n=1 Tax=Candidatus Liberibacter africanus PTSAPSY TaxID=1277257 RepID=A0A0G3I453_LIBAF|nr:rare lipoprotein A [Candidatus Liberibacter africanus PTSAPSY]
MNFYCLLRINIVCTAVLGMSSCFSSSYKGDNLEYFPESTYGVSASNRIVFGKKVPRGGGYYYLGKPYLIRGRSYIPRQYISYAAVGMASWYGKAFHGRLTANGEIYGTEYITAAHPTLPLPSYVRVTNLDNGISLVVRVNDRGPYHNNRLIDLSNAAAKILHIEERGVSKVHVEYLGIAPLNGMDQDYLKSTVEVRTKAMVLPLGCKYREEIVKIPYFLTRSRIVNLSNCDDDSLRKQRDITLKNERKSNLIPVPGSYYSSKKPSTVPIPSRL